MYLPETSVQYLFSGILSSKQLKELDCGEFYNGGFQNEEVYWLNTPGPIYTTQSDNCGTGQPEAPNNVGGDEDYYEFIFKQPINKNELTQTLSASFVDPWDGYFLDGNSYWTNEHILNWWAGIKKIVDYMVVRYEEELKLPKNPHNTIWDFGDGTKEMHLYGPSTPLPVNYKAALDFYQYGLKNYLEWYSKINNGQTVQIQNLEYNWDKKLELDKKLTLTQL